MSNPPEAPSPSPPSLVIPQKEVDARYRRVVGHLPAIVVELAPDGTTLYANSAVERLTGFRPREVQGKNWWELVCPDELSDQVPELCRQSQSDDVFDRRVVVRTKSGTLKTLLWSTSCEHKPDGTLEEVICYGVDITEHARADDQLKNSVGKLLGVVEGTVEAMAMTVEIRDPYTAGHQRRVAELACMIAREMGLSDERIDVIRLAGTIHDIGKISVPAEILSKPGRISSNELELIKAHPQVGYAILKTIDFPWPIAQIVYQHHERLDGSGYPLALLGDQILLESRILGVADVVESIAGRRPYRAALGVEPAIEEISKYRGVRYDAAAVDACLKSIRNMNFDWD